MAGCQSIEPLQWAPDDVGVQREQRREEMIEQFERDRATADLRLAREQWQRGDLDGCDSTLRRLLRRSPDHQKAILLLAELRLEQGRGKEILPRIASLADAHPDDAHLQYVAGVLLDACGDTQAAIPYYAKAAELEPANELYCQSRLSVLEAPSSLASALSEAAAPARSASGISGDSRTAR